MLSTILKTNSDLEPAILRLVLGVVFLAHGSQKALGLFGGDGFTATMSMFENSLHVPAVFAFLAIAAEFLGGIGLILGLLSRIAAFGIFVNMLVAIAKVHYPNGLFMNWTGKQPGEGIEFHLLAVAMAVVIMIAGAGAFSIDGLLYRRTAYWRA
jgi:putative oxidoreductase